MAFSDDSLDDAACFIGRSSYQYGEESRPTYEPTEEEIEKVFSFNIVHCLQYVKFFLSAVAEAY